MNNDNLIIQSSEGNIEYIGASLLESALKKDMEFPFGCSAGIIRDNDHYLLLVLQAEVLTSEIKKILESICGGKTIGLFGSYGWGDGQWMRDWEDRMRGAGATISGGEGVICQETPDADALAACEALGKALAAV